MVYSHSLALPWSITAEDERRFRKILTMTMALTIALGIAIPLLPVLKKPVEQEMELPPRVAKLVFEKRTEPKPKPKPKPVEKKPEPKPKPEAKKEPKPLPKKTPPKVDEKPQPKKPPVDALEQARKKASSAGLLALQDSLADLRDQNVDELKGSRRLSNSGAEAKKTERALITSKVGTGSKGINTASMSRDAGSTHLVARTATEVNSSIVKTSLKKIGEQTAPRRAVRKISSSCLTNTRGRFSISTIAPCERTRASRVRWCSSSPLRPLGR